MTQEDPSGAPGSTFSRRNALGLLGGAGLVLAGAACTRPPGPPTTTTTTPPTTTPGQLCILAPEQTEGPYYLSGEAVRSDITEGRPGVPLLLALTVVNATSCAPIAGATVDVWHCDAVGNYSAFGATATERTFLRGVQVAGADGAVAFQTIYPGWYVGRATHIHVKVHVGGNVVHTGQLYFDEAVTNGVYGQSPYSTHTGNRTLNAADGIYGQGGAQSLLQLTPALVGWRGALSLGVRT